MAHTENNSALPPSIGGIKVRSDDIAFPSESMIVCGDCGRSNPPNRAACFYCAHALVVVPEKSGFAGLKIKHPEDWEPALNVIVTGGLNGGQGRIETVARIINAEPAAIAGLAACERPLPLLRVSSVIEADMVVRALEDIGVDVLVVSDAELMPDTPPIRLRSLDFGDGDLLVTDFNTGMSLTIARSDVAVIVSGMIAKTSVEQLEKRRRNRSKLLDSNETSSDSKLLDIYTRNSPSGFRIMLSGFDFSCLGDRKVLLASENMLMLEQKLRDFAPSAQFTALNTEIRHALNDVWPVESRNDPKGLQRSGFARYEFGNTVSSTNLRQMNRYSRLQWYLK